MGQKENTIYQFKVKDINGKEISLELFKGKVLLIVNVASYCMFTPQYTGLEELYKEFKDKGFMILAFPCNQFGSQEPDSEEEILDFCTTTFEVSFPMFSKIKVNGKNTHPLYRFLKTEKTGTLGSKRIKWNFAKFLINKEGKVIERYGSKTEPNSIEEDILKLL